MTSRSTPRTDDALVRRTCVVFVSVFITLLIVPAVFQMTFGFRGGELQRWRQWLHTEARTADAFRRIEEDFNARFFLAIMIRNWMSEAGNVRGRDVETPWEPGQYLAVDADELVPRAAGFMSFRGGQPTQAISALADMSRQLQSRGIHLVVVPIPSKASIYPDKVRRNYAFGAGPDLNLDHHRWFEALRTANVDTVDLVDRFWSERHREQNDPSAATFTIADSHWTWHGIELAADEIANHIEPHLTGVSRTSGVRRTMIRRPRPNDLISRLRGDVPTEVEQRAVLLNGNGKTVLADDPAAPVLVIGDSFADIAVDEGSGLAQAIEYATGVSTRSAAIFGGSVFTMRAPLANPEMVNPNVRVIVFAFAIRHVITTEWPLVRIAAPVATR